MRKDLALRPVDFTSSFLSCEKDLETILRRLFVESQPYSNDLKRLLVINTKDCLDNKTSEVYQNAIKDMSLAKLRENGYIKFEPKIKMPDIDVLCHTDCWDLGDFRVRPLKICGYIDGILNNARLSGIGTFQFAGCNELVLDETLSGYTLTFNAIHGTDDVLPSAHGWIDKP